MWGSEAIFAENVCRLCAESEEICVPIFEKEERAEHDSRLLLHKIKRCLPLSVGIHSMGVMGRYLHDNEWLSRSHFIVSPRINMSSCITSVSMYCSFNFKTWLSGHELSESGFI